MKNKLCEFCNNTFNAKEYKFFCNNCGKLNSIDNIVDYFSYLDIPVSFPINENLLEEKYFSVYSLYHPDNFVKSCDKEKLNAVNHSSYVNNAYTTLKNNINLIYYLYKLKTLENINLEQVASKELAMFFFTLNEELDNLNSVSEKEAFKEKINQLHSKTLDEVTNAFIDKNYEIIKNVLIHKLKYIERLQSRIQ